MVGRLQHGQRQREAELHHRYQAAFLGRKMKYRNGLSGLQGLGMATLYPRWLRIPPVHLV